jgi:hypothetical protein
MSDPISLQLARQEIDRTFGGGYAAAHPELVASVMAAASSDYAAQLLARAIEHVAEALSRRRSCPRARSRPSRRFILEQRTRGRAVTLKVQRE